MQTPRTLVFDVGQVLLEWNVMPLFTDILGGESAAQTFVDDSDFFSWNLAIDGGRSFETTLELVAAQMPHHQKVFELFRDQWERTIHGAIDGTVEILKEVQDRSKPIYAITNFGAQTWARACALHPFLHESFRDVVVSGEVGLLKPDPKIYQLLLERNGLRAEDCLFIDDSPKNVAGAQAVGMQAIQFTGPKALRSMLEVKGIL